MIKADDSKDDKMYNAIKNGLEGGENVLDTGPE